MSVTGSAARISSSEANPRPSALNLFSTLPTELRLQIYSHLFTSAPLSSWPCPHLSTELPHSHIHCDEQPKPCSHDLATRRAPVSLLRLNRTIRSEYMTDYYSSQTWNITIDAQNGVSFPRTPDIIARTPDKKNWLVPDAIVKHMKHWIALVRCDAPADVWPYGEILVDEEGDRRCDMLLSEWDDPGLFEQRRACAVRSLPLLRLYLRMWLARLARAARGDDGDSDDKGGEKLDIRVIGRDVLTGGEMAAYLN